MFPKQVRLHFLCRCAGTQLCWYTEGWYLSRQFSGESRAHQSQGGAGQATGGSARLSAQPRLATLWFPEVSSLGLPPAWPP